MATVRDGSQRSLRQQYTESGVSATEQSESGENPPRVANIIKSSYLVEKDSKRPDAFKDIQTAINEAKSDSIIKISQGLYKENLVIRNKSIKLEAKDLGSEVYILGENGPAILIDNSGTGDSGLPFNVTLERIKIAHKGGFPSRKNKQVGTLLGLANNSFGKGKTLGPGGAGGDDGLRKGKTITEAKSLNKLPASRKNTVDAGERDKDDLADKSGIGQTSNNISADGEVISNKSSGNSMGVTSGSRAASTAAVTKRTLESYINEVMYALPAFTDNMNCGIMLKRGTLQLRNAKINLNLIVKTKQALLPGIIVLNNSTLSMSFCELRGSNIYPTVGVLTSKSNLIMKECTFTHFSKGGLCMMMEPHNTSKVQNCTFRFNKTFGIQLIGRTVPRPIKLRHVHHGSSKKRQISLSEPEMEETEIIQGCLLEGNECPAIQIIIPNCALIKLNTITNNWNGIEVVSADPRILENTITRNNGDGIYVKAMENMRAGPLIKQNTIKSNANNGILCTGSLCNPKISCNQDISLNKGCGIKVMDQAHPKIYVNRIEKNICQGILIVENSSAHIEKNQINQNIKANIAFGGQNSANTMIVKNTITKGRCEGIFMVEAGSAYVQRNIIEENYDGIVMITSAAEISNNEIKNNAFAGIMMMKDSRPKLYFNKIYKNKQVGLYIRDNCRFERPLPSNKDSELAYLFPPALVSPTASAKMVELGDVPTPRSQDREADFMSPMPTHHNPESDHPTDSASKLREEHKRKLLTFPVYLNYILDNPISLIVERPISNGKMIMEMNPSLEPELCRVPYTCREIQCIHKKVDEH